MPRIPGMALFALISAAHTGTAVHADIYKTVDKDGKVVFSDQPAGNAEPVRLGPTNSSRISQPSGFSAMVASSKKNSSLRR